MKRAFTNTQAALAHLGERQTEVNFRQLYLEALCSIHRSRNYCELEITSIKEHKFLPFFFFFREQSLSFSPFLPTLEGRTAMQHNPSPCKANDSQYTYNTTRNTNIFLNRKILVLFNKASISF